ncbi:MAG: GntR family transcriptional regulator [Rhodospirillaceae bacterium]
MRRQTSEVAQRQIGTLGRPQRLADDVYDAILGQLMSLKIPPGGAINIDDLAREFGVSQTPIREALGHLEAYGLVTKIQFVGYTAAPQLTKKQFDELCELRLQLEPYLAGKAAEVVDEQSVEALRNYSSAMISPRFDDGGSSYGQFVRQDAALHDRIAAAAGNGLMRETLAKLHVHLHLFRLPHHPKVTAEALDEHDEIVRGIAARDPKAASDAMRRHIEKVWERFGSLFDQD